MRRKLFLPLALFAIGVSILIGCIPLPGNFKQRDQRPRPESLVPSPLTRGMIDGTFKPREVELAIALREKGYGVWQG